MIAELAGSRHGLFLLFLNRDFPVDRGSRVMRSSPSKSAASTEATQLARQQQLHDWRCVDMLQLQQSSVEHCKAVQRAIWNEGRGGLGVDVQNKDREALI